MNILIIASPVQAIGVGNAGGVDVTLDNIVNILSSLKHSVSVIAPQGSKLPNADAKLIEISGRLQPSIQIDSLDAAIPTYSDGVIVKMCEYALTQQHEFHLILNMAYDWLPIWLTQFTQTPIFHLVSMSNENQNIADSLQKLNIHQPERIALHSQQSALTYDFKNPVTLLPNSFSPDSFPFVEHPKPQLAWVGRISPEKGLENAIQVAQKVGLPLHVWGKLQSETYKAQLLDKYKNADIVWRGFQPHRQLLQEMSESQVMLMTPNWIEAFGNNVVEAISCGVPVVAYDYGGPAEIIDDGLTGFLVDPKNTELMVKKVQQATQLCRTQCRQHALNKFDFEAYGQRLTQWLGLK